MYACAHVCRYMYIYTYLYIYMHAYTNLHRFVHVHCICHIYIHIYTHIWAFPTSGPQYGYQTMGSYYLATQDMDPQLTEHTKHRRTVCTQGQRIRDHDSCVPPGSVWISLGFFCWHKFWRLKTLECYRKAETSLIYTFIYMYIYICIHISSIYLSFMSDPPTPQPRTEKRRSTSLAPA